MQEGRFASAMEVSVITVDLLADATDEVLAALVTEDFDAFAELYGRYLCPVYRFVRSQTPDDSTAEDITAHVFFKAISSAGTFRADGTYKSWIFRIAHNEIYSWRSGNARSVVALEELPESVDPTPSPVAQAITQEDRGMVWRKVAELPPAQREVVALRYLQDLDVEEISGITGRSRGAVRILLHRARLKLRNSMEGDVG
jgi:RNA polymerase sigma-70 factor (ECF subfamily)